MTDLPALKLKQLLEPLSEVTTGFFLKKLLQDKINLGTNADTQAFKN